MLAINWLAYRITQKLTHTEIWEQDLGSFSGKQLTHSGGNVFPALSPDQRTLAYCHRIETKGQHPKVQIELMDMADQRTRVLLAGPGWKSDLSWGPEGTYLYYLARLDQVADIKRIRISDGQVESLTRDQNEENRPNVSPDGRWVAFIQADEQKRKQVFLVPTKGGSKQMLTRAENLLDEPVAMAWCPDSKKVAVLLPLALKVIDLTGFLVQSSSILGLVNPALVMVDPSDESQVYIKARANSQSLAFDLIRLSRKTNQWEIVTSANLLSHYSITSDGKKLIFEK